MKNKSRENKLVFMLNKRTIAHLSYRDMINVGSGEKGQGDNKFKETDPEVCVAYINPVPTDFGITPGIPNDPH
ncbi:MAG: hypothetical protein JSV88_25335 [Candidatus Aminicenantes bacterium]|nr:MAG: hypothetical protein JSV88_25335 [Candidatus Aminicenantes bacterium]